MSWGRWPSSPPGRTGIPGEWGEARCSSSSLSGRCPAAWSIQHGVLTKAQALWLEHSGGWGGQDNRKYQGHHGEGGAQESNPIKFMSSRLSCTLLVVELTLQNWTAGQTTAKIHPGQWGTHAEDRFKQYGKSFERGTPSHRRTVRTCDLNPNGSMPAGTKIPAFCLESKQDTEPSNTLRIQSKIGPDTKNQENVNSQGRRQSTDVTSRWHRCWGSLKRLLWKRSYEQGKMFLKWT